MIDKKAGPGQFTFDLPEAAIKQHQPPEGWQPPRHFPELHGVVGLDTETHDPGLARPKGKQSSSWARPGEGFVTGFSVASRAIGKLYFPLRHAGGNVESEEQAWAWLRAQAKKPDVTFVYANAIYDLGWLLNYGIRDFSSPPIDVQGLAALLDENRRSYSLDSLMRDFLGRGKSEEGLTAWCRDRGIRNPKVHMRRIPGWIAEEYAAEDAQGTLEVYEKLIPQIEAEGLSKVLELERRCLLVGRDLRWRGVRVDQDRAAQTKREFEMRRETAVKIIHDLTGVHVTPWDNAAIAKALQVEQPDFAFEKTITGQVSIRAGLIDQMQTPVSRAVRQMRKLDKAISTFFTGYIEDYVASDGRIHAEFHPLRKTSDEDGGDAGTFGTVSGRWSSSGPNLQNIPRRDPEIGPAIRRCFLPEEGENWLKADYSSQEPRIATHYASVSRGWKDDRGWWRMPTQSRPGGPLPASDVWVKRYLENPEMSFHKEVGKLMGLGTSGPLYDALKINNLALIYGMTGKTFCHNNGYPTKWITKRDGREIEVAGEEGQALINKHSEAVPWGRALASIMKEAADTRGYVKTILGRRIRYKNRYPDGRLMGSHKALNNAVQGTAAEQMKMAMVHFHEAGIMPLVVVHDDGNFSCPRGEAGERMRRDVAEIMANAIQLAVPSLAEMKEGETWGDV